MPPFGPSQISYIDDVARGGAVKKGLTALRNQPNARVYSPAVETPHRLRVVEAFRSIFYAPPFVAIHGGHFAAEGLDVTMTTAPRSAATVDALLGGQADLALSGLMRSFDLADRGATRLVHFAAVNDRNGFFLLGREPRSRFSWSDLVGRTVISFGGAPTSGVASTRLRLVSFAMTEVLPDLNRPRKTVDQLDVQVPQTTATNEGGTGKIRVVIGLSGQWQPSK